jgi:hypothetical protein
MQAFAALLDALVYTQSRTRKLALLGRYFRATSDPDRGWALAALTDGVPLRLPLRRMLTELTGRFIDPVLYKLSRDYVGDTAETVALLWPDRKTNAAPATLDTVIADMSVGTIAEKTERLGQLLDTRWRLSAAGAHGGWCGIRQGRLRDRRDLARAFAALCRAVPMARRARTEARSGIETGIPPGHARASCRGRRLGADDASRLSSRMEVGRHSRADRRA